MKYCSHCGTAIPDEAEICMHCGCRVGVAPASKSEDNNKTLGLIAKIFMIITDVSAALGVLSILFILVFFGVLGNVVPGFTPDDQIALAIVNGTFVFMLIVALVPLAWCIPMTVVVHRRLRDKQPIGTGFKICVLLFCNVVSGILLLCMKDEATC